MRHPENTDPGIQITDREKSWSYETARIVAKYQQRPHWLSWILGGVGTLLLAVGAWAATTFLAHGTRLVVLETTVEAVEKKVDDVSHKVDESNSKLDMLVGRQAERSGR